MLRKRTVAVSARGRSCRRFVNKEMTTDLYFRRRAVGIVDSGLRRAEAGESGVSDPRERLTAGGRQEQ